MKKTLFVTAFLFYALMYGQDKKICITIDDLLTVNYGASDLDEEITTKLVETLKKHNIPAIGYVNEGKLYTKNKLDSSKVNLLKKWLEYDMDLGNHTYSHLDYNNVSSTNFYEDIIKGEKIIKPLIQQYGKKLKYFRHPYLHAGSDSISYKELNIFLKSKGYTSAPVTIDNDDYLFAKAYHDAFKKNNTLLMKEIGKEYILYMEQKLLYFEKKSEELFNRQIPQTLLIHASLLNADYLDELSKMFKKQEYTFVSQEEVLKVPEYNMSINVYTKRGISWIFRWAMSMGFDSDFMKNDIVTPKKIIELTK